MTQEEKEKAKKRCKKIQEFIMKCRRRCDDCNGKLSFVKMRIVFTVQGVDERAVCTFECLRCGRRYNFISEVGKWI